MNTENISTTAAAIAASARAPMTRAEALRAALETIPAKHREMLGPFVAAALSEAREASAEAKAIEEQSAIAFASGYEKGASAATYRIGQAMWNLANATSEIGRIEERAAASADRVLSRAAPYNTATMTGSTTALTAINAERAKTK